MQRRRPFLVILATLTLAGCTSSSVGVTVRPATTPAPTSQATSSTPSPTEVPTSAVVTTTTAAPVVDAGWRTIDPSGITGQWAPPCCASNWYGTVSPALPAPGDPLLDGVYAVTATWGSDVGAPMTVVLHRFEQCALLPEGTCEDEGPDWPADAMGVDTSTALPATVPLDAHLRVVVAGLSERDADMNLQFSVKEASGADLAALALAVEQAFSTVLLTRLGAGMTQEAIIAEVGAHPEGGFGPGDDGAPLSLSFTSGDAPSLLFQAPFRYETPAASRGTDVLQIVSAEVVAGQLTLYVYASYYP